jgi:hypothetical protein
VVVSLLFGRLARGWIQIAGRDPDLAGVGHLSRCSGGRSYTGWVFVFGIPNKGPRSLRLARLQSRGTFFGRPWWRGLEVRWWSMFFSPLPDRPWWRAGCRELHRPLLPRRVLVLFMVPQRWRGVQFLVLVVPVHSQWSFPPMAIRRRAPPSHLTLRLKGSRSKAA